MFGIFSAGCRNSYGHPSSQVVGYGLRLGIVSYGTCEDGSVSIEVDSEGVLSVDTKKAP